MEYALAKELKDAGFPQKPEGEGIDITNYEELRSAGKSHAEAYVYKERCTIPTLSELIEALQPLKQFSLRYLGTNIEGKRWEASFWRSEVKCDECGKEKESGKTIDSGYFSTSEEAVANLWLALNKRN